VNKKISVLAPDLSGGGGTRVYLIAQVLQQLNCQVTIYGPIFGWEIYPTPPQNLPVVSVKGNNYPQFFGQIKTLLDRLSGEIIYAVKPRPTSFGIGLLKRFFSPRPLILDIDDWEMSWFGGDRWSYRPHPRQLARDILKKNGALRDPNHPLYLRWLENLINRAHKGLEDVLIALDQIGDPDFKLVVVGGRQIGDGYLDSLLEKGQPWLIHLPAQPLERMPEVVAAAHAIIVPQRDEATANAQFPIKLTDGMAMAKPIISTKVADIPEILADIGYLVEPRSPEQLAVMISEVFKDLDSANARGLKARERCIASYSTTAMATTLSGIITSLEGKY